VSRPKAAHGPGLPQGPPGPPAFKSVLRQACAAEAAVAMARHDHDKLEEAGLLLPRPPSAVWPPDSLPDLFCGRHQAALPPVTHRTVGSVPDHHGCSGLNCC
jgi:hypothetical protein